jgi:hypothetical protein
LLGGGVPLLRVSFLITGRFDGFSGGPLNQARRFMLNREKREEIKKYNKAREGLTDKEIVIVDTVDAVKAQVTKLIQSLHYYRFPEEYDEMYDSIVDRGERSRGVNPMSQKYIDTVSRRREEWGVSPLSESGLPVLDDSMTLCLEDAKRMAFGEAVAISLKS